MGEPPPSQDEKQAARKRKLDDVDEQLAELQRKRSELASECV